MAKKKTTKHAGVSKAKLIAIHMNLVLTREIEVRIEKKLYRQGKIIGGVYVGLGQEAVTTGAIAHLRDDDYVCPSHRDMGAFLYRNVPIERILAQ